MRRDESRSGQSIRRERASRVESKPAHPEQPCADDAERQVVGRHRFLTVADTPTEHYSRDQSRSSGTDMNHRAASEIKSTHFTQPSLNAPDPVGERVVDESRPQNYENEKRAEL